MARDAGRICIGIQLNEASYKTSSMFGTYGYHGRIATLIIYYMITILIIIYRKYTYQSYINEFT